jgi:hypothetical protein
MVGGSCVGWVKLSRKTSKQFLFIFTNRTLDVTIIIAEALEETTWSHHLIYVC